MKPAADISLARAVQLDRLNAGEREVLRLLAEGHTAKSIASLTGRSVGAVNERLREARRKTGVGSSRELARLLKAQESWDEEIGVAPPGPPEEDAGDRAAPDPPGGARKGAAVMIAIALAGLAGTALFVQGSPEPPAPAASLNASAPARDGVTDKLLGDRELEPRALHERFGREARDAVWAGQAEAALEKTYKPLAAAGALAGLRIVCAATVCEVTGTIVGKTPQEQGPTTQRLQDPPVELTAGGAKLTRAGMAFGGDAADKDRAIFGAWWIRG